MTNDPSPLAPDLCDGACPEGTDAPATPPLFDLAEVIDCGPLAAFVIDADHVVRHWNLACERLLNVAADDMVGSRRQWHAFYAEQRPVLADIIVDGGREILIDELYRGRFRRSRCIPGAFEATDFFPHLGVQGRWLHFTAAPLHDGEQRIIGAIETVQDVSEQRFGDDRLESERARLEAILGERSAELALANKKLADEVRTREAAECELARRSDELTERNTRLTHARQQIVQSEKLASIGYLAAGVAHEVNNPIGYVLSNFSALEGYVAGLFSLLDAHEAAEAKIEDEQARAGLRAAREKAEYAYLKADVPALMRESKEGIERVRRIMQDLKDFSRSESTAEFVLADLHDCIDSTLNLVHNELKYRADVERCYADLPEVSCVPSQINQVMLNLLVNAAHAMGETRGRITISTGCAADRVWIEVKDNGCGIAPHHLSRIFDPFFTTKPVGKGTGLGLSIAYGIVNSHHGSIDVESAVGEGTTFTIDLPVRQPAKT